MDRSIPHVRDIFAPYRGTSESTHDNKIHVYDRSPGNRRRRFDTKDSLSPQDFIDTDHSDSTDEGPINNNPGPAIRTRDKSRHSSSNNNGNVNRNSYNDLLYDKNETNSKGGYSSKTLTERDIRHLERHLSMKKTIRKQISRNLAQAFVDDTVVFDDNSNTPIIVQTTTSQPTKQQAVNNTNFTLTRAKMAARSEHTFLDMLKKDSNHRPSEADSGHSSPSHQGGFEDEPVTMMDVDYEPPQIAPYSGKPESQARHEPNQPQSLANEQHKKQSFWKKLGFKGKSKR